VEILQRTRSHPLFPWFDLQNLAGQLSK